MIQRNNKRLFSHYLIYLWYIMETLIKIEFFEGPCQYLWFLEIMGTHGSWPKRYSWKLHSTHLPMLETQWILMSNWYNHQNVYCIVIYTWGYKGETDSNNKTKIKEQTRTQIPKYGNWWRGFGILTQWALKMNITDYYWLNIEFNMSSF